MIQQSFHNQFISGTFVVRIAATALVALLFSCAEPISDVHGPINDVAQFEGTVATQWMNVAMSAAKSTSGFTPPVAARAYGYAGITLWESVANGISNASSLSGQINGMPPMPKPASGERYHWALVANSAMAESMRLFFATAPDSIKKRIETLEQTNIDERLNIGIDTDIVKRSVEYGQRVATAVYEYSKTDGGHEGYLKNFPTSYIPPKGEGAWIPTPPAYQAIPLQPYWGQNRAFLLPEVNPTQGCEPGNPIKYSTAASSEFYKEAYEVYTTVKNLSSYQKDVALYWSDDPGNTYTPAGHSMSICSQLIEEQGRRLDFAAKAFAMVGMSVNDAFIACWCIKYRYNLLRPISYIQLYIDSTWNKGSKKDPLVTPPFPEYVSGHSTQGGAAFGLMKSLFGDISFVDKTHVYRGFAPRKFASFDDALKENAVSRLYGGIHYRAAIDRGVEMGASIARQFETSVRFTK